MKSILWNTFKQGDGLNLHKVLGTLGFLVCIFSIFHPNIDANQYDGLLTASIALLGLLTIDSIAGKKAKGGKKNEVE